MEMLSLALQPITTPSPDEIHGLLGFLGEHPGRRVLAIIIIVTIAHLLVLAARHILLGLLRTRTGKYTKVQTLARFTSSMFMFLCYFAAIGLALREFGISLQAYIASATVIGFAVSFGSQGIIQDVITGITVITSDLIDVGDMVDIGGQVGIVESIGMRFTVLINHSGAKIYIPNRNVSNVINYEDGYLRVYLDITLASGHETGVQSIRMLQSLCDSIYEQFRGEILLPPKLTQMNSGLVRIKFRIWPGQGGVIEVAARQKVITAMRSLDADFPESAVIAHNRAESSDTENTLPRPAAVIKNARHANVRQDKTA